jgi:hypothetical protein
VLVKRTKLNYWVDMFIGAALIVSAVSGLVFLPRLESSTFLGVTFRTWDLVHTWSSLAMIAGAGLHLLLHWNWLVAMTRRMLRSLTAVEHSRSVPSSRAITRRRFLRLGLGVAALSTVAAAFATANNRGPGDDLADQAAATTEPDPAEPLQAARSTGQGTPEQDEIAPTPPAGATSPTEPLDASAPVAETGTGAAAGHLETTPTAPTTREAQVESPPAETQDPQEELGVACPFGLVNDPYPGRCRRYTDRDNDGVCDYSVLGAGSNKPRR